MEQIVNSLVQESISKAVFDGWEKASKELDNAKTVEEASMAYLKLGMAGMMASKAKEYMTRKSTDPNIDGVLGQEDNSKGEKKRKRNKNQELKDLKAEFSALKNEHEEITKQRDLLKKTNQTLTNDLNDLSKALDVLRNTNEQTERKYAECQEGLVKALSDLEGQTNVDNLVAF